MATCLPVRSALTQKGSRVVGAIEVPLPLTTPPLFSLEREIVPGILVFCKYLPSARDRAIDATQKFRRRLRKCIYIFHVYCL